MFIESVMPSNYLIFCRPFSSCPQSFPASNCFPMSQLFVSGGQSTIQGWFPLGSTSLSSLSLQGTLQSLLQHHNWKTSIFQRSAYYIVQLSHPYTTTGKTIILTRWTFVSKVMNLLSVQGTLKCPLQQHNLKPSILQLSAFFIVLLSHLYMTTGKTIALTIQTFVSQVMSLLFNILSRFITAFLPRSKHLNFSCNHCLQWFWSPRK